MLHFIVGTIVSWIYRCVCYECVPCHFEHSTWYVFAHFIIVVLFRDFSSLAFALTCGFSSRFLSHIHDRIEPIYTFVLPFWLLFFGKPFRIEDSILVVIYHLHETWQKIRMQSSLWQNHFKQTWVIFWPHFCRVPH